MITDVFLYQKRVTVYEHKVNTAHIVTEKCHQSECETGREGKLSLFLNLMF